MPAAVDDPWAIGFHGLCPTVQRMLVRLHDLAPEAMAIFGEFKKAMLEDNVYRSPAELRAIFEADRLFPRHHEHRRISSGTPTSTVRMAREAWRKVRT